jgi:hypothetical protein
MKNRFRKISKLSVEVPVKCAAPASPRLARFGAVLQKKLTRILVEARQAREAARRFWCPFCGQASMYMHTWQPLSFTREGNYRGEIHYRCVNCDESIEELYYTEYSTNALIFVPPQYVELVSIYAPNTAPLHEAKLGANANTEDNHPRYWERS